MLYVVMAYLWASIWLYLLLGGADFGAGIVELFSSKGNKLHTRNIMYKAIGPVWEANHMWLIIAVVILFVGFPRIYTLMSTYVHIPLAAMLLGIIARGTAFTFRNYDAIDDQWQKVYSKIFVYSSAVTPFFLGVIAGTTVSGTINLQANSFLDAYVFNWLNWFCVSVGCFTVAICGYLATIYIIGEVKEQSDKALFVRKAKFMIIAAFVFGALVFATAAYSGVPLAQWIFGHPVNVIAIVLAIASLLFMWKSLYVSSPALLRIFAGFQVTMILFAATSAHFPNIVLLHGGETLSLLEDVGSPKTIVTLAWALLIGSIFILPALFYLIYSFGKNNGEMVEGEV